MCPDTVCPLLLATPQHLLNRPVQIDIADGKGGGSGEGCGSRLYAA